MFRTVPVRSPGLVGRDVPSHSSAPTRLVFHRSSSAAAECAVPGAFFSCDVAHGRRFVSIPTSFRRTGALFASATGRSVASSAD